MKALLSSEEAADLLGYSLSTFYQLVARSKRGEVTPPLPLSSGAGNAKFYEASALLSWAEARKVKAPLPPPNQQFTKPRRVHILIEEALYSKLLSKAERQSLSLNRLVNNLLEKAL